jgi:hypothetical protein
LGRVRSLDRRVPTRRHGATQFVRGRVLSQAIWSNGYRSVCLYGHCKYGHSPTHQVQIIVLEAFWGPRPAGLVACHNDGRADNNAFANLRWDTASANEKDKLCHGTNPWRRRTHCPLGHLLERPNLVHAAAMRGARNCLACGRARAYLRNVLGGGDAEALRKLADSYYAQIMDPSPPSQAVKEEKICEICGSSYSRAKGMRPAQFARRRQCSRSCAGTARWRNDPRRRQRQAS